MEEFYYDKHPNLIGPVMKTTVCKIVKKPQINNTVSDKISGYVSEFYNDYINQFEDRNDINVGKGIHEFVKKNKLGLQEEKYVLSILKLK